MNPAEWIDISVALVPGKLPVWPGSPPLEYEKRLDMEAGDHANDSIMRIGLHTGTHLDAPSHFVQGAPAIESFSLQTLCGPCSVVGLPGIAQITAAWLEAAGIAVGTERLLFKTDNVGRWSSRFDPEFVGLEESAAAWLVERGVRLVGIDYLSVQAYTASNAVHQTLLNAGVAVLEGLNLAEAAPGDYELLCLPLKCEGVEAAPARALLLPLTERAKA